MAIAFDAATSDNGGSVTSLTTEHTCTGSDLVLIVGTSVGSSTQTVTGVTYNGVGMTKVAGSEVSQSQNGTTALWYLINPATGANDVVVSISSSQNISVGIASYTGASQSSQADVSSTNTAGSGTSFSTTLTTSTDNSWTIHQVSTNQNDEITAGSGTTRRAHIVGSSGVIACALQDSNAVITPPASDTLNADGSNSGFWIGGMITLLPATADTGNKSLQLLGVGN